MVWQDVVITIVIIFFSYALVPQIIKGFKEKRKLMAFQTTLITSVGLFIISIMYLTLGLFLSTIITFLSAILWAILFVQGIIYRNN